MVRTGGLEPPRVFTRRIFIPATAFAALPMRGASLWQVWGLDYPFTMAARAVGFPTVARGCRCRPSSLYTFPKARGLRLSSGAWLGISIKAVRCGFSHCAAMEAFPEFERFYVRRFHRRTQFGLSPLRLPIPPRPRGERDIRTMCGLASRTISVSRPDQARSQGRGLSGLDSSSSAFPFSH